MGEVFIDEVAQTITIYSDIFLYGSAASEDMAQMAAHEIESMWNETYGSVSIKGIPYFLRFAITGNCTPDIKPATIIDNKNPRNNFFRVEPFCAINISFVDALGSNTGYFLEANLQPGLTTAAHEYGHTLGLPHPQHLDIRGQGVPGIMYPRGTLVDAAFQYDPEVEAGQQGGTMHPKYRKVWQQEIALLQIPKLKFEKGRSVIGAFTNRYHEAQQA